MKREIEILFQLTQTFSEAKQLLDASNARAVSEKHTVDDYHYNRKTQQFLPDENDELKECLRIRQTEDTAYYAYKEDVFLPDGSWSHSDEYELKDEIRRKAQSLGLDCDTEIGVGKPELLLRKQDFQASHG